MMLSKAQEAVTEFHKKYGYPVREHPQKLTAGYMAQRVAWLREEIQELEDSDTMCDIVDALVDLLYFTIGTFVAMGIDASRMFEIVHKANMAKDTESECKPGKAGKPDGWVDPVIEIAKFLSRIPCDVYVASITGKEKRENTAQMDLVFIDEAPIEKELGEIEVIRTPVSEPRSPGLLCPKE